MTDDKNIKDMIAAVINSNKEDFETSFSNSIKDRLANNLATVHHSIAKDIVKTNFTTDNNEAFVSSLSFKDDEKEIILDDKMSIILNKNEAKSLIGLFESLKQDNRNKMIDTVFSSEKAFRDILEVSRGSKWLPKNSWTSSTIRNLSRQKN